MTAQRYQITGRTFDLKEKIKKAGGKWDSIAKCWTADLNKSDSIFRYTSELTFTLIDDSPMMTSQRSDNVRTGYCSICHSYCFGDCTASQ